MGRPTWLSPWFAVTLRKGIRQHVSFFAVQTSATVTLYDNHTQNRFIPFATVMAKSQDRFLRSYGNTLCQSFSPRTQTHKTLSYRWQTTRSRWHKTLRSTAFHVVLLMAALWWMTAIYWPDFPTFTYPCPIWEIPRSIEFIFGMEKTRMAGLQSDEGRMMMMIDSVVWVQHINVRDRQPRRYSKMPRQRPGFGRQK